MSPILQLLKTEEERKMQDGANVLTSPSSSPSTSNPEQSEADTAATSARLIANPSQTRKERRRQKRAGVKLAARVRPAELIAGGSYEVLVTLNASRQSLYFTTVSERYSKGMQLRVTFPYDSKHDGAAPTEDDGVVTRTERLPNKRIGVAVQLRSPAHGARTFAATVRPYASTGAVAERRITTRQPFSAEAVVVDSNANIRLQARCSDLSREGCYIDTLNPLPEGSIARVDLRTADSVFEAIARVNSSHAGMGMGLCFQDLSTDQLSVLDYLLSKEPGGRVRLAGSLDKPEESMDRTLALDLVRHMISKGILTRADITEIFFSPGII